MRYGGFLSQIDLSDHHSYPLPIHAHLPLSTLLRPTESKGVIATVMYSSWKNRLPVNAILSPVHTCGHSHTFWTMDTQPILRRSPNFFSLIIITTNVSILFPFYKLQVYRKFGLAQPGLGLVGLALWCLLILGYRSVLSLDDMRRKKPRTHSQTNV